LLNTEKVSIFYNVTTKLEYEQIILCSSLLYVCRQKCRVLYSSTGETAF